MYLLISAYYCKIFFIFFLKSIMSSDINSYKDIQLPTFLFKYSQA